MTHELERREENGHGITIVCTCGHEDTSLVPWKAQAAFDGHLGIANARAELEANRDGS